MSDALEKLQSKERELYQINDASLKKMYEWKKSLETSKKNILKSFQTLRDELEECESDILTTCNKIKELENTNRIHHRLSKCKTVDQYIAIKYSHDKYDLHDEKGLVCEHPSYLNDATITERCGCM